MGLVTGRLVKWEGGSCCSPRVSVWGFIHVEFDPTSSSLIHPPTRFMYSHLCLLSTPPNFLPPLLSISLSPPHPPVLSPLPQLPVCRLPRRLLPFYHVQDQPADTRAAFLILAAPRPWFFPGDQNR